MRATVNGVRPSGLSVSPLDEEAEMVEDVGHAWDRALLISLLRRRRCAMSNAV